MKPHHVKKRDAGDAQVARPIVNKRPKRLTFSVGERMKPKQKDRDES